MSTPAGSRSSDPSPNPPNRLAKESSSYLLQHAHNPVDWYPWGDEALEKAKELNRPIFLSVGYSSCHWCHVMERESFEDAEIAKLMNDNFINIKVDREERPDLDTIYMHAVQMITGSGGWPMSIFLTEELKPFWGGTYFPPKSFGGRPGFPDVLVEVARIFREERERVEEAAERLTDGLVDAERFQPSNELPGSEAIQAAVDHSKGAFDPRFGGFGPAPKFPRSVEISVLLRYYSRHGDEEILQACEKTLECMAMGGMYDQIGGGFHRYSTDATWLVPHFEKMLYDNALLARTYLEAYQATKKPFYKRIASEVLDYVLREMRSPEGGFYSATDADSEGEEGRFFVWTPAQVEEVLGAERAKVFCQAYNITEGGNFEDSTSIPHLTVAAEKPEPLEEPGGELGEDVEAVVGRLAEDRRELYSARQNREKPFRDEKMVAAWNALMISAFARGYQVLGEERYWDAAAKAIGFVREKLFVDGRLRRTYKDGRSRYDGFLDDYAYFTEALLDAYEASFDPSYLVDAVELAQHFVEHFWDRENGGFFYTAGYHEALICRKKDYMDNATPSGGAVAALNLLRLERFTDRSTYRSGAESFLRCAKPLLDRVPMAFGYTVLALDFLLHSPTEVAILGNLDDPAARELVAVVHRNFLPNKVLVGSHCPVPEALAKTVRLLKEKKTMDGRPTAYVCRDFSCQPPVVEASELQELLSPEPAPDG